MNLRRLTSSIAAALDMINQMGQYNLGNRIRGLERVKTAQFQVVGGSQAAAGVIHAFRNPEGVDIWVTRVFWLTRVAGAEATSTIMAGIDTASDDTTPDVAVFIPTGTDLHTAGAVSYWETNDALTTNGDGAEDPDTVTEKPPAKWDADNFLNVVSQTADAAALEADLVVEYIVPDDITDAD